MKQWTSEQKKAIEARGVNLIVSAGAGSGKTAVMIERICSLVRDGADISKMLAVTFTKTAAADMKRKLREALIESGESKLIAQIPQLSTADISTLHSWCSHLIKQWSFAADIDSEFTVLEEGEENSMKIRAAEEAIEESKQSGDKAFAGLYSAFLYNRNHRRLTEALISVFDYSRAQPYPEEWLRKSALYSDDYYRGELIKELCVRSDRLKEELSSLIADLYAANFTADSVAAQTLYECIESEIACTLATPQLRGKPELTELHERFKNIKAAYAAIVKRRDKIAAMPNCEDSAMYCRALGELAVKMGERYAEYKREAGKADYADLEHKALAILKSEEFGAEITGKYTHVFVDEYQDISPLQEEILKRFNCEMFFVGDVKQSIYGFRMCRPQYFLQKRREYAAGGGMAIELTSNFRSGGKILDAVNDIFSRVMTSDFGGADYAGAELKAGKELAGDVKAVLIEKDDDKEELPDEIYSVKNAPPERVSKSLEKETDAVINEILDMTGGLGYEFGDIAVLVRSRGAFTDLLERKMRALSIPVCSLLSDSAADTFASVAAVLSYMRLIDNARDDVNLCAVMLSQSIGKFTADELAEIRASGTGAFCDCVYGYDAGGALGDKIRSFKSELDYFAHVAAASTPAELAGEITSHYGCFNGALMLGGEREAAALDAFTEHLANQTDCDTLHEYIRYIDRCGVPKLSVPDGGRSVRIMTVHASKGLEFPCVILPNLNKQFNRSDVYASVICDADEGIVLRSFDFENRAVLENPRFAVCSAKLKRALAEEEMRILYVAMTRAQVKLSMFSQIEPLYGCEGKLGVESAGSYIDWMLDYLKSVAVSYNEETADDREEHNKFDAPPDENTVAALKSRFAESAREQSGGYAVKASVSGVARSADDDNNEYVPAAIGSDDRAAERGSAYHKFMQWVDYGATDNWEKLCARFPAEAELVRRDEIEKAFDKVRDFIGGRKFAREKQFVYNAPARLIGENGDGNVLVQGVIDLIVFSDDGADIVDYKTGDESHMHSLSYARQLALYKMAAESGLGITVNGTYLYSFSAEKFIKIETEGLF